MYGVMKWRCSGKADQTEGGVRVGPFAAVALLMKARVPLLASHDQAGETVGAVTGLASLCAHHSDRERCPVGANQVVFRRSSQLLPCTLFH